MVTLKHNRRVGDYFMSIPVVVWQAMIAAGVTITLAWMSQRNHDVLKDTAEKSAIKTEEVKQTLDVRTDRDEESAKKLSEVVKETHALVNSSFQTQLRIAAVALRRVADLSKLPEDIRAAEDAEKLYTEHKTKQDKLDKRK